MSSENRALSVQAEYDPVFLHSRREAIIIVGVWALGLIWSVPYCYFRGYNLSPQEIHTIWGIPSWVFWGIGVPWLLADLFTAWFCFRYMSIDDLGKEQQIPEALQAIERSGETRLEPPHE